MNVLYFDIETTDLIEESVPIADMEIGCLCTQMVNYPTHKSMNKAYVKGYGKLDTLVAWFNFADAVVGFNVNHFDYEVMSRHLATEGWKAKTIDMMETVVTGLGRRASLNTLTKRTLGQEKSMHGKEAVRLWQQGEYSKVTDYCFHDVQIMRLLFEHGCCEGSIKTYDAPSRQIIKIDTSRWVTEIGAFIPSPITASLPTVDVTI